MDEIKRININFINIFIMNTENTMVFIPASEFAAMRAELAEIKAALSTKVNHCADEWLSSEAARKMLNVSVKTWQTYRDRRILPFAQFGRKIMVKRADIEAFLNNHCIKN